MTTHESDVRPGAPQGVTAVVRQRQPEVTGDSHHPAVVLCDRGTLDGVAYWPGVADDYWSAFDTSRAQELTRDDAVIHLQTPTAELGYNHQNPPRTESAARALDALRAEFPACWRGDEIPSVRDRVLQHHSAGQPAEREER